MNVSIPRQVFISNCHSLSGYSLSDVVRIARGKVVHAQRSLSPYIRNDDSDFRNKFRWLATMYILVAVLVIFKESKPTAFANQLPFVYALYKKKMAPSSDVTVSSTVNRLGCKQDKQTYNTDKNRFSALEIDCYNKPAGRRYRLTTRERGKWRPKSSQYMGTIQSRL